MGAVAGSGRSQRVLMWLDGTVVTVRRFDAGQRGKGLNGR